MSQNPAAHRSPPSLFAGLRRFYQHRFDRWLASRLQPARSHTLNNRRLFIMPSRAGYGFLLVVVLLWLTGTNYDNNLVLALAFFLAALFVVCIHHTFFNMTGLHIEVVGSAPCFLGEDGELELVVSCAPGRRKEALRLALGRGNESWVDLLDTTSVRLKLFTPGLQRGWYRPPRLRVESRFPLGLIRCWSWVVLDQPILVYPRPQAGGELPQAAAAGEEGKLVSDPGAEDFYGFRGYQQGESLRHIAWKHYARGQGLHVKEYSSQQSRVVWLDFDAMPGVGLEARLSRLCYWVLHLSATHTVFGLRLPGVELSPGQGMEHRQRLLRQLALYRCQPQVAASGEGLL